MTETIRAILHSSKSSEWFTPPEIIEEVRAVFGGEIDLDPASCELANLVVQATEFFTIEDDGLSRNWFNNWFCNPPYGAGMTNKWVDHAIKQSPHSNGILLMNNTTDRTWFHKLWDFPICFLYKRIQFYESKEQWQNRFIEKWVRTKGMMPDPEDIPIPKYTLCDQKLVRGPQPTHGNVLVYFGSNFGRFDRTMRKLGHVVIPRRIRKQ